MVINYILKSRMAMKNYNYSISTFATDLFDQE